MNFDNMPELRWHYGYYLALGVMLNAYDVPVGRPVSQL